MSNCSTCSRARNTAGHQDAPKHPSRRGFFGTLSAAALVLVAWPRLVLAGNKPWVALPLSKAPKLKSVGGSMLTRIRGKDLLVVRDSETTAHAFESICPHEGCPVNYAADKHKIECPCHDAFFDLQGKVLQGPPPRGLETYAAFVDGDRILINVPAE
jgi:nitrite reductase/ring-hydroxylating ferredoxin subunit